MDPNLLGFFALVIALVAIAYREREIAKKAIDSSDELQEADFPKAKKQKN